MSSRALACFISLFCLNSAAVFSFPAINRVRTASDTVGLYQKFELRVNAEARFNNPYDPDEVALVAEFTAPSGKVWKIDGFFNPTDWETLWMVRFAPDETGAWRYVLRLKDREGEKSGGEGSFQAVASGQPGWVGIAPNGRYLRHSDGSPFYGVGLWYNDSYEEGEGGEITPEGLDQLKNRGCNFISFFPTPIETRGTGAGRYEQARCARMDRLFEMCESRGIRISWNLWFHSYISETVWGGGNARWGSNPYREVCAAKDFFNSAEAWRYSERLLRYTLARWGYSSSLFLWFVVDEIDGTDGWVNGDTLAAEAWCLKVHKWLKDNDPWGRPTTGTQCGAFPRYWSGGYRIFDIPAREIYEAQRWPMPAGAVIDGKEEHPLRASLLNYTGQTACLWAEFGKPVILGECGWAHTYYEPSQPGYLAMYHNALWGGLVNGLCCTPFWWAFSDYINDNVVTNQLQAFARFVEGLDLTGDSPAPLACRAGKGVEAWAMRNGGVVFGWAVNPRMTGIAGQKVSLDGLADGEYTLRVYHTWRGRFVAEEKVTVKDGRLTVTAPSLVTTGGRANQLGDDFAFLLTPSR
jgi:hypothetical protein